MTGTDAFYIATLEEGLILEVNSNFENVFGYTREEVIGKTSLQLGLYNDPADQARTVSALKAKGYVRDLEIQGKKKGGELITVSLSVGVLLLNNKRHILGIIRDITEQQQAEAKIMEIETLKRVNQAKTELLSTVAHELKTPLASIKGNIESLLETDVTWSKRQELDFLQAAYDGTDRLALLIRDLLDMARIDSGRLSLNMKSHQVSEILDSVHDILSVITAKHKLKIIRGPDLPPLQGDITRIGQVITNLTDNATKFSQEGSPILIKAIFNEGNIVISVEDSGLGLAPEQISHLFDRFYQAHQPVSGKARGTGLGLAICRGIVESHGGKIWVESQPGKGSRFIFSIPATNR
jgi:two-component system, OmpR family, sensor histidine kinase KdpD